MGALQDMDHTEMMRPITKWAKCVHETKRIPDYIAMAFRVALTGRYGPVFLEIPSDVLFGKVEEERGRLPAELPPGGQGAPRPEWCDRRRRSLRNAERPLIMARHGDLLGRRGRRAARVRGEGAGADLPERDGPRLGHQEHPLFFNRSRRDALGEADVILFIGTTMDFRLRYGKRFNPEAKMIQVDIDPNELGRNRDIDIAIEADAKAFLEAITAEIRRQGRPRRLARELRDRRQDARAEEEWLPSDRDPIHPLRLCNEIAKFVDEDTIVVGDGGDIVGLASQVLPVNQPGQLIDPGPLGTLGVGTGFCMAINSVYPNKRVLMVNGDGAFGLNGFDFDTFVRFNMPVVSVVGNDRQWGQILVGQAKMYGEERVVASSSATTAATTRSSRRWAATASSSRSRTRSARRSSARSRRGKPACVNVIIDQEPPGIMGGYEFM